MSSLLYLILTPMARRRLRTCCEECVANSVYRKRLTKTHKKYQASSHLHSLVPWLVSSLSRLSTLIHRDYYYFYNTYIKSRRRELGYPALFPQIRINEDINIPIKHCIHIAHLQVGSVVFHKAVRLEDIGPDLVSP